MKPTISVFNLGEKQFAKQLASIGRQILKKSALAVSLVFVDDQEIRKLNKTYRKLDRATDVLSFEIEAGKVGEIYIALPTAERNAKRFKVSLQEEIIRLWIHGLLHLLGFDHVRQIDRRVMRKKEEEWLCRVN